MIITIDGPTGTGKSTVAKKLAETLHYTYFDTGAMYRCLTYGVLKNNIDIRDQEKLLHYLKHFIFRIQLQNGEKQYFVGDTNVSSEIRGDKVTNFVSEVSAIPIVREHLVEIQRNFAKGVDCVFEGRDIGTVVFPKAELKIYLTGRPEVRAERRHKELLKKFPEEAEQYTFEKVLNNLQTRDQYDTNRAHSPLRPAKDAHIIDTSDLSVDQVVEIITRFL